jgi:hypothetical protein
VIGLIDNWLSKVCSVFGFHDIKLEKNLIGIFCKFTIYLKWNIYVAYNNLFIFVDQRSQLSNNLFIFVDQRFQLSKFSLG